QPCRLVVDEPPKMLHVDVSPRVRLDLGELVAGHRDAGGVRAVGGVGDDDLSAAALATVGEIGAHEHEACQLSLRPCRRLERNRIEAAYLREDLLKPPLELERALRSGLLLERMEVAEARKRDDRLVDA